jgi:hypothetical protein
MAAFKLSGLDVIQTRIEHFKKQHVDMIVPRKEELMTQFAGNTGLSFQGMYK